ncbi:MAG TPA: hypothetical protein VFD82_17760 [Planctomycetota bacterium]|nr:hypothetical protein [Planctomycetota bacterium]
MRRHLLAALLLPVLPGCSVWFFSAEPKVDRTRPVALVETTGGIELGATTEFGVLTLGRSAASGPCRVHYFLGPTPLVEDGELKATGSLFTRAEIDLKTQALRALDRGPAPERELLVMWTPDGVSTRSYAVQLAREPGVEGDVLVDPGVELPAGATVMQRNTEHELQFAGLIAGKVTLGSGAARSYYVFAGVDRMREMLAVPQQYPVDLVPKYRLDDIQTFKPVK